MAEIVPLDAIDYRYRITTTVDGVDIGLRVYWLDRAASWYVDLETDAGVPIATGARLSPGAVVAFPGAGAGVPPGRFVTVGPEPYQREDLGTQIQLVYVTQAEIDG